MKRTALKRGKPLQRGTKRLKARKTPKAFRQRRDPAYQAWVRQQGCLLTWQQPADWKPGDSWLHQCRGRVQVCHVRSRGAGGDDRGNCVNMCAWAHEEQHRIGIKSFQARWGIDLPAAAARLYAAYLRETGGDGSATS